MRKMYVKKTKGERKEEREEAKRLKREERAGLRGALRDKLRANVSRCEIFGCTRKWTDMHHVKNPGRGLKDDSYTNVMGLCHDHHMEIDGLGKQTWAKKHFLGCNYEQVAEYTAMMRGLEEQGRQTSIANLSFMDVPSEGVFELLRRYAADAFGKWKNLGDDA